MVGGKTCTRTVLLAALLQLKLTEQLKVTDFPPEPDSTFSMVPTEKLPQRPMWLFVHLEKSAGSFLSRLFMNAVSKNSFGYHWASQPIRNVPKQYFVVSSIRNPCTQVLSQWSYCCEKAWVQATLGCRDSAAMCGQWNLEHGQCPRFTGLRRRGEKCQVTMEDANTAAYARVLNTSDITRKLYEEQFNRTFKEIGPDRVNCWIRFESLEQDTRRCLREYSELTGYAVDWAALDGKFGAAFNAGHHKTCGAYYNAAPGAAGLVAEANSFLFRYFGYGRCCEAEAEARPTTVAAAELRAHVRSTSE